MAEEVQDVPQLQVENVLGFSGHVFSGLRVHPDREFLIYPLGCTVILKNISDGKQQILLGHTSSVSCLSVSKSGSYIASGQVSSVGSKATIIIWNYAERGIHAKLDLHKTTVEAVAFSPSDKYLVSLGGLDDNRIVVWNIETKLPICVSSALLRSSEPCLTLQYFNTNDDFFVSAGSGTIQIWKLNLTDRKIHPTGCNTGKLKRMVKCLEISEDDQFLFCGTTSGDIMKINLKSALLSNSGPVIGPLSLGVNVVKILKSGDLLVGSGAGVLALCSKTSFKPLKKVQLEKGVTSIAGSDEEQQFFIGTEAAQMYRFSLEDFTAEAISSSHSSAVRDVAIPSGTSELFATCSNDIRLWSVKKPKEVLCITVPHVTCNALDFMVDGSSIISAWDDGKIRVFTLETGRLMHTIHNAHKQGVTAIAGTRDGRRIISGGGQGEVHVWELLPHNHRLLGIMKEHKAAVLCVKVTKDDKECVSASQDGTCIIWDLVKLVSIKLVKASTLRTVCYHPEEFQILTSGTNSKIVYWMVFEDSPIRVVDGSLYGSINDMDVTQDGKYFVTGGEDQQVRVWDYVKGVVTHVGRAHGGSITSIKVCPNSRVLLSTSADGGIIRWKFPHPSS
uniref:Cilia- and flagella-associated protein 52 n=1 Tax=Nothobranchius kadleci TaxID=1051664 RepID=A0A1A8BCJ0_NOTKA